MVFRTLSGLVVAFFVSSSLWASETGQLSINPSHPNQYTVVEGDTLWDISGKFLNHPTQWPALWSYNAQIKNPHLIYPGDTVYFSVVNGSPRLSFSKDTGSYQDSGRFPANDTCVVSEEDIHNGRTSFAMATNGKLSPCIRETNMKQAIRLIPTETIAKYLSSPKVVGANELNAAPYVVDLAGEHLIAGTGDKLYVRSITNPQTVAYTVYRAGATFQRPETGEILGYEAKYVADTTLEQEGDPATVVIDKSLTEILIGDRLMPKPEEQFTLNYFPRPPEDSIKGSIISVLDGVSEVGKFNVVVIDKGTQDGLLPGHELDIFKRGRTTRDTYSVIKNDQVKLPDEIAGSLMVFRPFDRVSYALVMKANQAIHVLDKVQTP
ncbi:LysM domain-containing protein [Methyloglobulus sp.]|uniref:LysM peptidoglycan-binding domain-containing protein n=1 Tax=Methyloglobulus sp. TaxID=2518622 RepID=UPI0017F245F1|nr:LysM peptidoglycan-binding domain-containing protein [Methyloglobulus sp.]